MTIQSFTEILNYFKFNNNNIATLSPVSAITIGGSNSEDVDVLDPTDD